MIFFEFIGQLIIEYIFEGLIKGLFKLFRKLGVLGLKILTLNKTSLEKLDKEYYKDSSKPYFVAIFIIIGIIYLIKL